MFLSSYQFFMSCDLASLTRSLVTSIGKHDTGSGQFEQWYDTTQAKDGHGFEPHF